MKGSVEPVISMALLLTNLGIDKLMKGAVVSLPAIKLWFKETAQLSEASHDFTANEYLVFFTSPSITMEWFVTNVSMLFVLSVLFMPYSTIVVAFSFVNHVILAVISVIVKTLISLIIGLAVSNVDVVAVTVSDNGPSLPVVSTAETL